MKRSFIERVKQVMSIVICVALVAAMAPAEIAMAGTGSYEGTQQNDFAGYTPVSTKEELNNIRYDLSGKYYLTRDIVFSEEDFLPEGLFYNAGKGWIPIGDSDSAFSGVIDGNGHTISGLEIIESPAKGSCSGFIGINSGEIINLCIDNYSTAATSSQEAVGTIVGRNSKSGTIKGCINKSSVTGRLNDSTISYTGGVVGWNAGNIINCSNTGYVTGGTKFSQGGCVGGIAGYNEGLIKECYNDGDVQNGGIGGSSATTGGIAGKDDGGAICDCYNIATIIGAGSGSNGYAGGIAGYAASESSISNCYNMGNIVKNKFQKKGAITGNGDATIANCYFSDTIPAESEGNLTDSGYITEIQAQKPEAYGGFDFDNIWCFDTNYPYPQLINCRHAATGTENTTDFAGGKGTADSPYLISNKEQLNNMRNYMSSYFRMTQDIIFNESDFAEDGAFYNNGVGFISIGDANENFSGVFDGNGYAIKNLYQYSSKNGGLFGIASGTIKNLAVIDSNVYGKENAGAIVAELGAGTIVNCYSNSSVKSAEKCGGIAGSSVSGAMINVYCAGTVEATTSSAGVGGISGYIGLYKNIYFCNGASSHSGANVSPVVGKCTEDEMTRMSTFVGFDFENLWGIDVFDDYQFPQFRKSLRTISGLQFLSKPSGTLEVLEGCEPDFSKYSVQATYIDGGKSERQLTADMLKGFDKDTPGEQTAELSYRGIDSKEYINIFVKEKTPVAISIRSLPEKTEYIVNEENLDISGAVISVEYDNEFTEDVEVTPEMVSGFDNSNVGELTLTISYAGLYTTFNVNIICLDNISVSKYPDKTTYVLGQPLNTAGGEIKLTYSNGSSKTVPLSEGILKYDAGTVGNVLVSVEFKGKEAQFSVSFEPRVVDHIIANPPDKTIYKIGEELDVTGGSINVVFVSSDGYNETVPMEKSMISGYDKYYLGSQKITVIYDEKTSFFNVTSEHNEELESAFEEACRTEKSKVRVILPLEKMLNIAKETDFYKFKNTRELLGATTPDKYVEMDSIYSMNGHVADAIIGAADPFYSLVEFDVYLGNQYFEKMRKHVYALGFVTIPENSDEETAIKEIEDEIKSVFSASEDEEWVYSVQKFIPEITTIEKFPEIQESFEAYEQYMAASGFGDCLNKIYLMTIESTSDPQKSGFTFVLALDEKTISGIEIKKLPDKVQYIVKSECPDFTGGVLQINYADGTSEEKPMESATATSYNFNDVGDSNIELIYRGFDLSYNVEIVEKKVDRIYVSTLPEKVTYYEGQDISLSGGELNVEYNDGTCQNISMNDSEVHISGYDKNKIGKQSINVEYGGQETTFEVEVIVKKVISIQMISNPDKLVYLMGEELETTGGEISVTYETGETVAISITNEMVAGFDSNKEGIQILKVSYEGYNTFYDVDVQKIDISQIAWKSVENTTYTGAEITPEVSASYSEKLVKGEDYTVEYSNNISAGVATIEITGIGKCKGTKIINFTIDRASISEKSISLSEYQDVFDGKEKKPEVIIEGLTEGKDFCVEYFNNINAGNAMVTVEGMGNYCGSIKQYFTISKVILSEIEIKLEYTETTYDGTEKTPKVYIDNLVEGEDFTVQYFDNVQEGTAYALIKGSRNSSGNKQVFFTIKSTPVKRLFKEANIVRLFGNNRYDTSIAAADELKKGENISKFNSVIVADGRNYADALAGTYLAKVKGAPILVVGSDNVSQSNIRSYIKNNLNENGTVYILGGAGAVSAEFEKSLSGCIIKRLGGSDRFETNLKILKEAGVTGEDILVCSGLGFADSLSASAVGKPILLVGTKLTTEQNVYLSKLKTNRYYIIGGDGAVNTTVESSLKRLGTVSRVYGQNRYETSVAVAEKFFGGNTEAVVMAYGLNFPDGLSGGPLAMSIGSPLLLVTSSDYRAASVYAHKYGITKGAVLGGESLISDEAVKKILT